MGACAVASQLSDRPSAGVAVYSNQIVQFRGKTWEAHPLSDFQTYVSGAKTGGDGLLQRTSGPPVVVDQRLPSFDSVDCALQQAFAQAFEDASAAQLPRADDRSVVGRPRRVVRNPVGIAIWLGQRDARTIQIPGVPSGRRRASRGSSNARRTRRRQPGGACAEPRGWLPSGWRRPALVRSSSADRDAKRTGKRDALGPDLRDVQCAGWRRDRDLRFEPAGNVRLGRAPAHEPALISVNRRGDVARPDRRRRSSTKRLRWWARERPRRLLRRHPDRRLRHPDR